jgi:hypothetical protein
MAERRTTAANRYPGWTNSHAARLGESSRARGRQRWRCLKERALARLPQVSMEHHERDRFRDARDDQDAPLQGVFSTRSPDRPNPIGLHHVQILAIDDTRIRVRNLEAIDRTPVVDIKPLLGPVGER